MLHKIFKRFAEAISEEVDPAAYEGLVQYVYDENGKFEYKTGGIYLRHVVGPFWKPHPAQREYHPAKLYIDPDHFSPDQSFFSKRKIL